MHRHMTDWNTNHLIFRQPRFQLSWDPTYLHNITNINRLQKMEPMSYKMLIGISCRHCLHTWSHNSSDSQNIFYFYCFIVKEETFVSRKQNYADDNRWLFFTFWFFFIFKFVCFFAHLSSKLK